MVRSLEQTGMEGPGQFSDFTLDPKARGEVSGRDGTDERRDTGVSEPWVCAAISFTRKSDIQAHPQFSFPGILESTWLYFIHFKKFCKYFKIWQNKMCLSFVAWLSTLFTVCFVNISYCCTHGGKHKMHYQALTYLFSCQLKHLEWLWQTALHHLVVFVPKHRFPTCKSTFGHILLRWPSSWSSAARILSLPRSVS